MKGSHIHTLDLYYNFKSMDTQNLVLIMSTPLSINSIYELNNIKYKIQIYTIDMWPRSTQIIAMSLRQWLFQLITEDTNSCYYLYHLSSRKFGASIASRAHKAFYDRHPHMQMEMVYIPE